MKPEDIIVGQCYIHKDIPETIYLGIGYTPLINLPKEKRLIVIYGKDSIGHIVVEPSNSYATKGFWDNLQEFPCVDLFLEPKE